MSFAEPSLLFGLFAVPLAALAYLALDKRRTRRAALWSNRAMLPNIVGRPPRKFRHVPQALFLLGLTFLLLGLARPQRISAELRSEAPTIVLAFDVSGSMAARDVPPTRIRAARSVATRFVNELPQNYRLAVVSFASTPRLIVAPTFDRARVLAELPNAVTPRGGTALGDGVSYAVAVIVSAAGQSDPGSLVRPGAVLLLSDGGQDAGGATPKEAAVSALVDYVPVDTIAIGTGRATVTQPVKAAGVETSTQIAVPVQTATLRALSRQTGGSFFEAAAVTHAPVKLEAVYANLHASASPARRTQALSAAAAGVALVFILGGIALSGLWFGRVA